jgi:hypothetical protein
MDRSLWRLSLLVGGAVTVGALLAGCASAGPGPAVIVAPLAAAAAPTPPAQDFLAGLQSAIAGELNAVNAPTQSDSQSPLVLVELNSLTNARSANSFEIFQSLLTVGANQIAKRERVVNALIQDVKGSSYLDGVSVNGSALSQTLVSFLEGVNGKLQSLATSIATASLPDVLRTDIIAIGASTRVFGLVEPMIHLAIAAGFELHAVSLLENSYATLSHQVSLNHRDPNYSAEVARLQDLADGIATSRATASAAVLAVMSLTPSGYPGNKSTIVNERARLVALKAPLGPLNGGVGDVNEIETLLAQRH